MVSPLSDMSIKAGRDQIYPSHTAHKVNGVLHKCWTCLKTRAMAAPHLLKCGIRPKCNKILISMEEKLLRCQMNHQPVLVMHKENDIITMSGHECRKVVNIAW